MDRAGTKNTAVETLICNTVTDVIGPVFTYPQKPARGPVRWRAVSATVRNPLSVSCLMRVVLPQTVPASPARRVRDAYATFTNQPTTERVWSPISSDERYSQ